MIDITVFIDNIYDSEHQCAHIDKMLSKYWCKLKSMANRCKQTNPCYICVITVYGGGGRYLKKNSVFEGKDKKTIC